MTVTEGNAGTANATFTVTLSAAYGQPVTVNYSTANGTATAGSDFQTASGTLTFAPGETSKTITVAVLGDQMYEPNETFAVNLSGATNATIGDGNGIGTIVNDDTYVTPSISIGDVSKAEGRNGSTLFTFTVTLSVPSATAVTVNYSTANGTATAVEDYTAASGTLTFAPGETTKTITIKVKGDRKREADETFFVNLFGVSSNALILDAAGDRHDPQRRLGSARAGLADRARDPTKGFSGGMKRRLNIACGISHQPEVVLLDEPTVGVDPQSRERIWEMLDRLKQAGASLVLTTHLLDEAQTRGDRIVIIDHGKTIAAGTFAELVERTVGTSRQITLTARPPTTEAARRPGDCSRQQNGSDSSRRRSDRTTAAAGARSGGRLPSRGHCRPKSDVTARFPSLDWKGAARMTVTILRVFWLHLRRDRVVWVLTFIVPVAFFSIFALIFAGQGKSSTPAVKVAVVDEDGSDFTQKLIAALQRTKRFA